MVKKIITSGDADSIAWLGAGLAKFKVLLRLLKGESFTRRLASSEDILVTLKHSKANHSADEVSVITRKTMAVVDMADGTMEYVDAEDSLLFETVGGTAEHARYNSAAHSYLYVNSKSPTADRYALAVALRTVFGPSAAYISIYSDGDTTLTVDPAVITHEDFDFLPPERAGIVHGNAQAVEAADFAATEDRIAIGAAAIAAAQVIADAANEVPLIDDPSYPPPEWVSAYIKQPPEVLTYVYTRALTGANNSGLYEVLYGTIPRAYSISQSWTIYSGPPTGPSGIDSTPAWVVPLVEDTITLPSTVNTRYLGYDSTEWYQLNNVFPFDTLPYANYPVSTTIIVTRVQD